MLVSIGRLGRMGSAVINSIKRYFTVTITKTGNGTVTPDVGVHTILEGTEVTIQATETDSDYYLDSIYEGATQISNPYVFNIAGNRAFEARFIENKYAQNFIRSVNSDSPTLLTNIEKSAIRNYVNDLFNINLIQANFFRPDIPSSSVLKAIYPLIGNNRYSKRWNLVNPLDTDAAFRITWNNPANYTFDYGVTRGNGVDANGDTHFIHSNLNGAHFSTWLSDFYDSQNKNEFGDNIVKAYFLSKYSNNLPLYALLGGSISITSGFLNNDIYGQQGMWLVNRKDSSNIELYRNNYLNDSRANTATGVSTQSMKLHGLGAYFSSRNILFASMGDDGLTDAARTAYYNATRKYLYDLGYLPKVVGLGDSISGGFKATSRLTESFANVFALSINSYATYINRSGYTIANIPTIYNIFKDSVDRRAIVLFQEGSNETVADATWFAAYCSFIELMLTDGFSNIMLIGPPYSAARTAINAQLAVYMDQAASTYNLKHVRCDNVMDVSMMDVDLIHPNTIGHAFIGQLILNKYNEYDL